MHHRHHNQQCIQEIAANPNPQRLYWAPDEYQTEGNTKLFRTVAGYLTKAGKFKDALTYVPNERSSCHRSPRRYPDADHTQAVAPR